MSAMKARLLSLAIKGAILAAVLGVLVTLTIVGVVWLLDMLHALLGPLIGNAWSMALITALCFSPLLVALLVLRRLARATAPAAGKQPASSIAELVRNNPWEAASLAFVLGFSYKGDTALRLLLLKEGLATLAEDDTHQHATPDSGSH